MKVISREQAFNAGLPLFYTGKLCRNGHRAPRFINTAHCRTCDRARGRRWRKVHKQAMLTRQRQYRRRDLPTPTRPEPALCECCGNPPTAKSAMHLDHCHSTHRFRGWLCKKCNTAIGMLGDTLAGLAKAQAYLERFEKGNS